MSDNPIRGLHRFRMQGVTYTLQYTWEELAALESVYGANGPQLGDFTALAHTASVGLIARHPEMTPEHIRKSSPPVFILQQAVTKALKYAYFGDEREDAIDADAAPAKKKLRLWQRFMGFLSGMVARIQSSGQ